MVRARLHELYEENIKQLCKEFNMPEDKMRDIVFFCKMADSFNYKDEEK